MKEKNKKGNRKMRKGLWSPEEDERLMSYMVRSGQGCWSDIARNAGLQRCGKSCRLRWINYLRPDLKRGAFSPQEEALILHLHSILGNRWSQIAARIPGRTDNEIKNFWNSTIKKRLKNTNNLRPSPTTTTITTTTPPNNANIPFSTASIQELDTTNVATYSLTAMPTFLCKDNSSSSSASSFSSYNSQLVEPISHHDQLFLGNTIIQNEMIMGNLGFGEFVNVDLMQDELGVAPTCVGSNDGGGPVWEQNGHGNCTRMGVDSNIFVAPYSLGFNRGPVFGDFGAKVVENIEEKGAAKCMKVEGKINVIDSNPVINFQNIGDNLDLPFAGESSRSVGDQWDLETLLLGEASLPFLDFHA